MRGSWEPSDQQQVQGANFFKKLAKNRRNKPKQKEISPKFSNWRRFFQKIADISFFTKISSKFGEIYEYFFYRHFAPLFRFADPQNTKFRQKKPKFSSLVPHTVVFYANIIS